MTGNDASTLLLGRDAECRALDDVLDDVRAGVSRVLVLRGEPGVGKTALLDHLARRGADCRTLRAAGVEAEMELAYAGLHQLCAPILDVIPRLPPPQRDALATAFGLRRGEPPDRFLIGLAVLTLLSEVSEKEPIVGILDDAQWLDTASAQTLGFVARRLLAEPVALVFATRGLQASSALQRLPELTISGLGDEAARTLLDRAIRGRLDDGVREQIVAETGGNPLAILELPRGLTAAQLAGGFVTPGVRPLARRIEQNFLRQLEELPEGARRLLLVASAEPTGDLPLLRRAALALAVEPADEWAAEGTGLIDLRSPVRFRHPLVRSSIYLSASLADRRVAHQALADATDPVADPDRRAWHRAYAAAEPDESVASDLERSAERARERGGIAAAAAFLERSARLTPEPALRSTRALAAAHAKFEAADPDAADQLLATTTLGPLDGLHQALLARLRAQVAFARRRGSDAPGLLLHAAKALESHDVDLARETYLDALGAATFAGGLGDVGLRDVALAARAAPVGPPPARPIDLLLDAIATLLTDGYPTGMPVLRDAMSEFRTETLSTRDEIIRWLGLACPLAEEAAVHQLWDFAAWQDLASRAVQLARGTGALAFLPVALVYSAGVRIHLGDFAAAAALIEEADEITAATGLVPVMYAAQVLAAWRGDEAAALELVESTLHDATERGEGLMGAVAGFVTAVLYNGLGQYDAARDAAASACANDGLSFSGWALVELVEACVRSGAIDEAEEAVARLEERTVASGTDWALGVLARSRALVAAPDAAEALYSEAIRRLQREGVTIYVARARLVYGEWLRRENRRVDARRELRTAHDMFSGFGARAFTERARRELLATGETVRRRTATGAGAALTAQEAQVASLTVDGLTNSEIGTQLFISPRTVEYHLSKVFAKLGIRSRRELKRALVRLEGNDH